MTDIVERILGRVHDAPIPTERLLDEAADEIKRLRREINHLRVLVQAYSDMARPR